MENVPLKQCSNKDRCIHPMGCWQPEDNEHFYKAKRGLTSECIHCLRERSHIYAENHREQINERGREYSQVHRDKKREYNRLYRQSHREEIKERMHLYHEENREELHKKKRIYRENHRQEIREHVHDYREQNKEKQRERDRRYREQNREAIKERKRIYNNKNANEISKRRKLFYKTHSKELLEEKRRYYQQSDPDHMRVLRDRRRARERASAGSHTAGDIRLQVRSQTDKRGKLRCWWCSKIIKNNDYHVDHRIPLARGGSNAPENLCISCPECNLSKQAKLPGEWNGRLL